MIQGPENRLQAMRHVYRILKPGGIFVLHLHSIWYNLFSPIGRRWIAGRIFERICKGKKAGQLGDKFYAYRGVPQMFLHTFTQGEMTRMIRQSGFQLARLIRLSSDEYRQLQIPWFFGSIRANGWIAVCRKKR
jgi:ubiquinone/menaquinone biosynthesis C-methylase UbiE